MHDRAGWRACEVRHACGVVASPMVRVLGFPGQLVGEETCMPQLCFGGEVHP